MGRIFDASKLYEVNATSWLWGLSVSAASSMSSGRLWALHKPYSDTGILGLLTWKLNPGSMFHVFGSTSTNTGTAPAWSTASVVLAYVNGGTATRSPGFTPNATSAECIVAVPLQCAIAYLAPTYCANWRSNSATSCPFCEHLSDSALSSKPFHSMTECLIVHP